MTFYVFLKRHFKKRKKSCFLKSEKNVKYVFSNTVFNLLSEPEAFAVILISDRTHVFWQGDS